MTREWAFWLATVTVAVGVLWVLVVPSVVRRTSVTRCPKTKADIVAIDQACEEFFFANGRYPTELEELVRPDAEGRTFLDGRSVPLDPWRRSYCYVRPAREGSVPRIFTLGRDGETGGDGDDEDVSNFDIAQRAGIDLNRRRSD